MDVLDLALSANESFSAISKLVKDCFDSQIQQLLSDSSILPKWAKRRIIAGDLNYRFSLNKRETSRLVDAGLSDFNLSNPLHVLSLLHPERAVRLAALKLSRKLDINVTEICNLKCSYCYQKSRDDAWEQRAETANDQQLSADDWKKVLDEAAWIGVTRIKFTGGEPVSKKGFFDILEYAHSKREFSEIEIVTNATLLRDKRLDKLISIFGEGQRLFLFLSIDGYSDSNEEGRTEKILTPEKLKYLTDLFLRLPLAKFAVNSMWTSKLLINNSLWKLHNALVELRPKRWTISLPYIVKDVIDGIKHGNLQIPTFSEIVEASSDLLRKHMEAGNPFDLSVPLLWKFEASKPGFSMAVLDDINQEDSIVNHPCFPCHGSYFILGPRGQVFDCLLLSKSNATYKKKAGLGELIQISGKNNKWYEMTPKSVSQECIGCRYERLCKGQCPNDRVNGNTGISSNYFGRDLSACSMLQRAERHIWPQLPNNVREKWDSFVNKEGFLPASWESMEDIIRGLPPKTTDQGNNRSQPSARVHREQAVAQFHQDYNSQS